MRCAWGRGWESIGRRICCRWRWNGGRNGSGCRCADGLRRGIRREGCPTAPQKVPAHSARRGGSTVVSGSAPRRTGTASGERTPEPLRGEAARTAARRAGCTVLLKGPVSWSAPADGAPERIEAPADGSAGWLATAGSGDVLAGFCAGLMARGMSPSSAAGTAVRWHYECGRLAGPGLIAEDLPEVLPRVLRRLLRRPSLAASPVGGRDGGDPHAKPPGAHPGSHEGPGPAGQGAAA